MKYIAVALVVCALMSAQIHPQFEYRGIRIGETEQQVIDALNAVEGKGYLDEEPLKFDTENNGTRSIHATVDQDQSVYVYMANGKVARIEVMLNEGTAFTGMGFRLYEPVLIKKYGAPRRTTSAYQNSFGVTIHGKIDVWRSGDQYMKFTEFCAKVTYVSCLTIDLPSADAALDKLGFTPKI